jgi:hypothetical protein
MKTLVLILISILYTSFCKLIAEQWSASKILSDFRKELVQILALSSFSKFPLPNYENKTLSLSLTNINPALFVLDTDNLKLNLDHPGIFLYVNDNPGDLMLKYTFNYTIGSSAVQGGNVTFTNTKFTFYKNYYADANGYTKVDGDVTFDTIVGEVEISGDQSILQTVIDGLNIYTTRVAKYLFVEFFRTGINTYYPLLNQQMSRQFIDFTGNDPKNIYELDIGYSGIPTIVNTDTVVLYRKGELNDYTDDEDIKLPVSKSNQFYVSKLLLKKFIQQQAAGYDFTITSHKLPDNTPFELNIQYLGQLASALYDLYPRSARFEMNHNITNIYLDSPRGNSMGGVFEVGTEIELTDDKYLGTKILNYLSYLNFTVKDELVNSTLNFYIDSVEVIKVYYEADFILNIERLIELQNVMFKSYLSSNKYYFIKDGLDLSCLISQYNGVKGFFVEDGYILQEVPPSDNVNTVVAAQESHMFLHSDLFRLN